MLKRINDINNLSDPLKQFQIDFQISNIRGSDKIGGLLSGGSGDSHVDSKTLALRCESYSYPGSKIEQSELKLFMYRRKRAAAQDKSGVWKTTLIEGQSAEVLNTIQNWLDLIHNPVTGIVAPSILYISLCNVTIHGLKEDKKIYLRGFYPIEISTVNINASSSEAVKIEVSWNYDWYSEGHYLGL